MRTTPPPFNLSLVICMVLWALIWVLGVNQTLFYWINGASQLLPATWLAHITELGNGALIGLPMVAFLLFKPQFSKPFLYTTVLTALLVAGLKDAFDAPRPASVLDHNSFTIIGDVLRHDSFPSGHTATAFSVVGLILLSSHNKQLHLFVLCLGLMAGLSRIAVGAHWPLDIVSGAFVGLGMAWVGVTLGRTPFGERTHFGAVLFLGLAALAGNLTLADDFPEMASISVVRDAFAAATVVIILVSVAQFSQRQPFVRTHIRRLFATR